MAIEDSLPDNGAAKGWTKMRFRAFVNENFAVHIDPLLERTEALHRELLGMDRNFIDTGKWRIAQSHPYAGFIDWLCKVRDVDVPRRMAGMALMAYHRPFTLRKTNCSSGQPIRRVKWRMPLTTCLPMESRVLRALLSVPWTGHDRKDRPTAWCHCRAKAAHCDTMDVIILGWIGEAFWCVNKGS
jgi:hypothetical protein